MTSDYRQEFIDAVQAFRFAVSETMLVAIVARAALERYPMNIADSAREVFDSAMRAVSDDGIDYSEPALLHPLVRHMTCLTEGRERSGRASLFSDPTFLERTVCAQTLMLLIAHLEAFLFSSLKVLYFVAPEKVRGLGGIARTSMSWADTKAIGSVDDFASLISDDFARYFCALSADIRLERISKKFGLGCKLHRAYTDHLEKCVLLRNKLVHNGGRVDKEAQRTFHRLEIGDELPVTFEDVEELEKLLQALWPQFSLAVQRKYFDA